MGQLNAGNMGRVEISSRLLKVGRQRIKTEERWEKITESSFNK